jgi:acyl-activating enzyme 14
MAGGCHVFIPKFEAASTLNAIQKHSVIAMIIVPTMLADIVTYYNPSRSKDGGLELCFPTVKKILNEQEVYHHNFSRVPLNFCQELNFFQLMV